MSVAAVANDRVRLPFTFDVEKMKAEVKTLGMNEFIYYNVIPLRAPAHQVDPSLPLPPPADDYADGTWTEWLNIPAMASTPYLTSIIDKFQEHTRVTLVRVLRLAAGNEVKEHTDPTLGLEVERSVVRLTIPILVGDEVDFFLNGTPVPMQPGECWYLRLTDPHKVVNGSTTDRINLTIDMAPNDWLRNLIQKAATND
ncbi:aspartyl/asparaginyl beta-hydroxylase [Roseivirga ehrenbergii]|uniref:Aspartyl beta-hydroxylase n=1 Tax=Roseivirga ehrenbergii (strain DSM 102268 / JCM 13514 / KCTC 12282 / NCIMB 14502 / KMM 6017) TaxID=279360 RepID=A0A150X6R1_ROSEK|nr:aspartyl/asparaginyl beta-hydroxylase domain-containing protein [Roseivirga ehrenbergii]KYG74425.1 aspartyl beta-hydroxylase [Roseivirga ehrenbergii]TCL14273.1 aspartyl/asparaginyl beta-hydroxylase [Roseivirga ehrenbergii]